MVEYRTDNEFVDFYSYWEKIMQNNFVSLPIAAPLMSTARMSSAKVTWNPSQSELKQLAIKFQLCKFKKNLDT